MIRAVLYLMTLVVLLPASMSFAGMTVVYEFTKESDGQMLNSPFGTLTVSEGFNTDYALPTLKFDIWIDPAKLGGNADIHEFGFQLNYQGTIDLVPKPQYVGGGAFKLKELATFDKVAGYGNTRFDYVVDFGKGANPTLNPVSFIIGAPSLSIMHFDQSELIYRNNKLPKNNDPKHEIGNFAVHVQSTGSNQQGSEAFSGYYEPNQVVPELGNLATAAAAVGIGLTILSFQSWCSRRARSPARNG